MPSSTGNGRTTERDDSKNNDDISHGYRRVTTLLSSHFRVALVFLVMSALAFLSGVAFRRGVCDGGFGSALSFSACERMSSLVIDATASLLPEPLLLQLKQQQQQQQASNRRQQQQQRTRPPLDLPKIVFPSDKKVPETMYTSNLLDAAYPALSLTSDGNGDNDSSAIKQRQFWVSSPTPSPHASPTTGSCRVGERHGDDGEGEETCIVGSSFFEMFAESHDSDSDDDDSDDDDEEENVDDGEDVHFAPKGEHLMVDIERVDSDFLASEVRLATAMVQLINASALTMLSYHCHSLPETTSGGGVSCLGVLLESHVSFHTWPSRGVVVLDVFSCGDEPLMPLLPHIERLFGVPRKSLSSAGSGRAVNQFELPHAKWAYKARGFDRDSEGGNPESVELNAAIRSWTGYEYKKEIASVRTNFQTVDIVDIIDPKHKTLEAYKKSHAEGDVDSYESKHRELFIPDRLVYLDGVLQSRRYGDAAYHESLVHPGMLAHNHPRRVAIIGGGEGATLREVLKHKTVEKVVMIEIDEIMANVSRDLLPEWSYCGNLAGSTDSCFDEPRADVYYEDAITWFVDRFGDGADYDVNDRFDVVIMDAL